MANKNLFQSTRGKQAISTDGTNNEISPAYEFSPEHALCQYTLTGCLNSTFYASAEEQLETVIEFSRHVSSSFIARLAVYAREQGYMKDLPALFCALLSARDPVLLRTIFPRVIDNGKMLRNFVQIMRSGVIGRKSLGTFPKKLILEWLQTRSDEELFRESVGNSPSLSDIVKMVHPKPNSPERETLYGYLLGRQHNLDLLPTIIKDFEAYKSKETSQIPAIPFQMLASLDLGKEGWKEIARTASWQTTRMNLNTFARHNVFDDEELVKLIAQRLSDPSEIKKARVFPYQLLVAYQRTRDSLPPCIREALQDAMEIAVENIPKVSGQVVVCPDVSGSMRSPATGYRQGATSDVRCIDIAALVAAATMRNNPSTIVLPFEESIVPITINPRDSIMTNAQKLAAIGGGGTNCSAPLALLNRNRTKADLVVLVSDNESWIDARYRRPGATATMQEWQEFRHSNPKARLVCIDIQPYATTQAHDREDILNIGGFSDQVFTAMQLFCGGLLNSDHLVALVNKVSLDCNRESALC